MALKAMVVKADLPDAGKLLEVHDDAKPLPPLWRDNDGAVIAEWVPYVPPAPPPPPNKAALEPMVVAARGTLESEKTALDGLKAATTPDATAITTQQARVDAAATAYGTALAAQKAATA